MKSHSLTIQLAAMLMSMVASVASAYDFVAKGIYYNLITKAKIAEVTCGTRPYDDIVIDIPPSVTYEGITYNVTRIGNNAFSNCSNLTNITIPNSVTSIGSYAFEVCI